MKSQLSQMGFNLKNLIKELDHKQKLLEDYDMKTQRLETLHSYAKERQRFAEKEKDTLTKENA